MLSRFAAGPRPVSHDKRPNLEPVGEKASPWRAFFLVPPRDAARRQRDFLSSPAGQRLDLPVTVILILAAMLLTVQHYFDASGLIAAWAPEIRQALNLPASYDDLCRHCLWATGQIAVYVVAPVLAIKLVFRQSLADYGVKVGGMFSYWWLYLAMFGLMMPLVVILAHTESFRETYPFFRPPAEADDPWRQMLVWELFYALQFCALEFFFRGFLLHGLKHRFGPYAILVSMIPYCMIHFEKPMPETFGAIGAGIVLGFMSLKTRSIWMGAALHISVALTMDFTALLSQ